jgi:hypothetical protein
MRFDLTAVSVSPSPSQTPATVATSPAVPLSPAPLLVPSLTSNQGPDGAVHSLWRAARPSGTTVLEPVFADLDNGQLSDALEA